MSAWVFMMGAVVCEVAGTLSLRAAVDSRRWYAVVTIGYTSAFTLLSLTLAAGMPLAVAYGIWTAAGVALTAIFSRLLFHEPLTRMMIAGIVLIMVGVLLVELGTGPL